MEKKSNSILKLPHSVQRNGKAANINQIITKALAAIRKPTGRLLAEIVDIKFSP
jgi:hypothetical protein